MRTQYTEDDLYECGVFYNRHEKIEPGYTRYVYLCVHRTNRRDHRYYRFVNVLGGKANFLKLLDIWNCTNEWYYYESN